MCLIKIILKDFLNNLLLNVPAFCVSELHVHLSQTVS